MGVSGLRISSRRVTVGHQVIMSHHSFNAPLPHRKFEMPRHSTLPAGVSPRGLNITQAAEYWGCGPSTFKKLMKLGIVRPIDMAWFHPSVLVCQAGQAAVTAPAKEPARPPGPP